MVAGPDLREVQPGNKWLTSKSHLKSVDFNTQTLSMSRFLLPIAILCLCRISSFGQSGDKAGVEGALTDYIEGFYEGDSIKLARSISPEVVKYGYWKDDKSGKYGGEGMSWKQIFEYASGVRTRNRQQPATAPRKVEVYEVQEQTASGKVTAWWGTDYILLEKIDGKWKIRMVLWQGPAL